MSSAAYNSAQAGIAAYRVGYPSPQSRSLTPGQYTAQNARPYMAPQATLEQQELQRLKNLKAAIQAANRVMSITCKVFILLEPLLVGRACFFDVSIQALLIYSDVHMCFFRSGSSNHQHMEDAENEGIFGR